MSTAGAAIARRAFRQLRATSIVLGLTFGAVAASAALTYVDSFPDAAARARLAESLSGDAGFSVLFGAVADIGSVGGYTAYKCYVFLTTIGAVWAALAVTRLLRGEEDTGRWQVLLAGRATAARATAATLVAVAGAIAVVTAGTAALTMLAGLRRAVGCDVASSIVFALTIAIAPVCFAALAALCSQLAQTRRVASSLTMAVFAVAFVIRMIGDATPSSHWLLWATPLGWVELVRPFTRNDLLPFAFAATLTAAASACAIVLAGRRDAGGGVIAASERSTLRAFGLHSPAGLAVRLTGPVLAGWAVGIAAMSFVLGIVSKAAASAVAESSSATSVLSKLGATGQGATQYLGVVFLLTGAVLALVPAGQIASARDEEASGRLVQVVARPPSRRRWLAGRLAVAASAVVASGFLAGTAAWAGAKSQGVDVGFADTLLAGVNVMPAALLALSAGAIVFAVAPRWAPAAVYVLVGGSLVLDLLGSLIGALKVLTRASLFHYVSLAPAQSPRWSSLAAYVVIAAAATFAAVVAFDRRDLSAD